MCLHLFLGLCGYLEAGVSQRSSTRPLSPAGQSELSSMAEQGSKRTKAEAAKSIKG